VKLTEPRAGLTFEGCPGGKPARYALAAAKFNAMIVEKLVAGAMDALTRHGVDAADIDLAWVPGALELPLVVQRLARSRQYAAVIALGTVIRGDTSHYDIVAGTSASGCAAVAMETGVPVLNAILTVENLEQALARAGGEVGNKGFDAAMAALEMVDLLAKLPKTPKDRE
jgi:6,7-dimethyl-8-ribityllumazine synthase